MIIINDEQALRVKCDDVLPEEVGQLISTLENELNIANRLGKNGIGLAAPQIGIAKNIAIVRMKGQANINLINCKIKNSYDPAMFKDEGCLSFPGRTEDTMRFQEIHIVNNLEYPHAFIASGLISVVCQHELDHLNGILLLDNAMPKIMPYVNKSKIRPNDPCICGSNRKYKKCCYLEKK